MLGLLLLLAWTGCGGRADKNAPGSAPAASNLILIVIDTLRRDHLSVYGYKRPTSPNLERLARGSVVFEECRAQSSWTQPSTLSLLSGLYPTRHGAHEYATVDPEIDFLSEELVEAGFATAAFSGNPNVSPQLSMDQGFETFQFMGGEQAKDYPDVSELLRSAEQWLERRSPRERFFLYLHLMNVHGPYRAPDEFRRRFMEEPAAEFKFQCKLWTDVMRKGEVARREDFGDAHRNDLVARYDGAIAYTDQEIGAFLDRLESRGILEDSLLIVTSDHGEELFDHGGFGHGFTLYSEMLDVPLILRPPGLSRECAGARIRARAGLIDVAATALDYLGLGEGSERTFGDGRSLRVVVETGDGTWSDRPLCAHLMRGRQGSAFLFERPPFRWIGIEQEYTRRPASTELFRLDLDPADLSDLSALEPEALARLAAEAGQMREALEQQSFTSPRRDLDEETRQRLEKLGYEANGEETEPAPQSSTDDDSS